MSGLIGGVLRKAVEFASKHKVLTGLGLGALVLPKVMGAGSPQAMMGAQTAIGNQLPMQGGMPPAGPMAPPPGASF